MECIDPRLCLKSTSMVDEPESLQDEPHWLHDDNDIIFPPPLDLNTQPPPMADFMMGDDDLDAQLDWSFPPVPFSQPESPYLETPLTGDPEPEYYVCYVPVSDMSKIPNAVPLFHHVGELGQLQKFLPVTMPQQEELEAPEVPEVPEAPVTPATPAQNTHGRALRPRPSVSGEQEYEFEGLRFPMRQIPRKPAEYGEAVHLSKPLSEYALEMPHVPVDDMEAFVARGASERFSTRDAPPMSRVARPMNAFMLYRKAYTEVAKAVRGSGQREHVSRMTGASWRLETEAIQRKFQELAAKEMRVHSELFPRYKYRPGQCLFSADENTGTGRKSRKCKVHSGGTA